jgi:hypothetical protein
VELEALYVVGTRPRPAYEQAITVALPGKRLRVADIARHRGEAGRDDTVQDLAPARRRAS